MTLPPRTPTQTMIEAGKDAGPSCVLRSEDGALRELTALNTDEVINLWQAMFQALEDESQETPA